MNDDSNSKIWLALVISDRQLLLSGPIWWLFTAAVVVSAKHTLRCRCSANKSWEWIMLYKKSASVADMGTIWVLDPNNILQYDAELHMVT